MGEGRYLSSQYILGTIHAEHMTTSPALRVSPFCDEIIRLLQELISLLFFEKMMAFKIRLTLFRIGGGGEGKII